MQCPHCLHAIYPATMNTYIAPAEAPVIKHGVNAGKLTSVYARIHTCPRCKGPTVEIAFFNTGGSVEFDRFRAYPRSGPFPPAPPEVPAPIAADYAEANEVLPISPKASAALARRCLQAILASQGYTQKDLVKQIEAVLKESDPARALPLALRENIDAIRNFGNFSAHPVTDKTTLQIVDVEEGEAEWCLQLLVDVFEHYYVAPAKAAAKRAALSAKLSGAGKPPMKK